MERKLLMGVAILCCSAWQSAQAAAVYSSVENVQFAIAPLSADPVFQPQYVLAGGYSYVSAGVSGDQLLTDLPPGRQYGWFAPVSTFAKSEQGFAAAEIGANSLRTYGQVNGIDQRTIGDAVAPYFDGATTIALWPYTQLTISADLYATASIANTCVPDLIGAAKPCEYAEATASLSLYSVHGLNIDLIDAQEAHALVTATGSGVPELSDTKSLKGATLTFNNYSDSLQTLSFHAMTRMVGYSLSNDSPLLAVPEPSSVLLMALGLSGLGMSVRRHKLMH
jgi:hypothetical protein